MTANNSQTAGTTVSHEGLARAEALRKAGLVHITGLPVCHPGDTGQHGDAEHLIQASFDQLGQGGVNNGKVVLITPGGEVWLGVYKAKTYSATREYATVGNGSAFVPCSNGETIYPTYLLERIADPYSDCGGRYPAIPKPKS